MRCTHSSVRGVVNGAAVNKPVGIVIITIVANGSSQDKVNSVKQTRTNNEDMKIDSAFGCKVIVIMALRVAVSSVCLQTNPCAVKQ